MTLSYHGIDPYESFAKDAARTPRAKQLTDELWMALNLILDPGRRAEVEMLIIGISPLVGAMKDLPPATEEKARCLMADILGAESLSPDSLIQGVPDGD